MSDTLFAREHDLQGRQMDLFGDRGQALGHWQWGEPPRAMADQLGARVGGGGVSTTLVCEAHSYRLDFDRLRGPQGELKGMRYVLRPESGGEVLAELLAPKRDPLWAPRVLSLSVPLSGRFVPRWRWGRGHWDWLGEAGERLGQIIEPRLVTLRRELQADLPGMSRPQQAFCLYVFCSQRYQGRSSVPH